MYIYSKIYFNNIESNIENDDFIEATSVPYI